MDKNMVIKETQVNSISLLVDKKLDFFKDIIQKTVLHVYKNKLLNILGINDVNTCIETLDNISKKINILTANTHISQENLINELQTTNNELSGLLKIYGTTSLEDMLLVCFGTNTKILTTPLEDEKLKLLNKYFHPTGYKVLVPCKKDNKGVCEGTNICCSDISSVYKQVHMKIFGIQVIIHNRNLNKSIIVFGIVDDVIIDLLQNDTILLPEDVKDILRQQWDRLSDREKQILSILAKETQPLKLSKLIDKQPNLNLELVNVLQSLQRRCLVDKIEDSFWLSPLIKQYLVI